MDEIVARIVPTIPTLGVGIMCIGGTIMFLAAVEMIVKLGDRLKNK